MDPILQMPILRLKFKYTLFFLLSLPISAQYDSAEISGRDMVLLFDWYLHEEPA